MWLVVSGGAVRAQAPSAQALNQRAVQALSAGDTAGAIRDLEQARRLAQDDPRIAFNLGFAYVKAGRFAEAVAPLERSLDDAAGRDKARFLLGTVYFELRRYQLCAARMEPLRSHPDYAEKALYFL